MTFESFIPQINHTISENIQISTTSWHREVVELSFKNGVQPPTLVFYVDIHHLAECIFDVLKRPRHSFGHGLPPDCKLTLTGLSAVVGSCLGNQSLRLLFASFLTVRGRKP